VLEVGDELGPLRIEAIEPERMKTMAVLLQDPNPIHIRPEAAREAGLGDRVVNQGPRNMAFLMRLLLEHEPAGRIERFTARFVANVFAGDTVVATGKVLETLEAADGMRRFKCELALDVDGAGRALDATAAVAIPLARTDSGGQCDGDRRRRR
jgi:acyl dehydratase